ncbi:hypothetical protein ACIOHS_41080 [Streptomyces sp. NPDC088253]
MITLEDAATSVKEAVGTATGESARGRRTMLRVGTPAGIVGR